MSVWSPFDTLVRGATGLWMPWLGKSFIRTTRSGVNVLRKSAAAPIRTLWRDHPPARVLADRLEAFPFRTWQGPGAVDPSVTVLKIDYDFEANPSLVRSILDEVVEVGNGVLLGKILFSWRGRFRLIGFFSLRPSASRGGG